MAGDYPSTDFAIYEEGDLLRVIHLQTGMEIVTVRAPRNSLSVSSAFTIETEGTSHRPQEVAQAALRASPRMADPKARAEATRPVAIERWSKRRAVR
jgi:hypothetical protein